jgi:hypothetical protein
MASTCRFALRLSLTPDNKTPARLRPEVFSTEICTFHKVRQLRLPARLPQTYCAPLCGFPPRVDPVASPPPTFLNTAPFL